MTPHNTHTNQLRVLSLISGGLIAIILTIVLGLFLDNNGLPNWAENVLVSVATACALKLGDCISALIALSTGRQVESLGNQLANSGPANPPPHAAPEGASQAADAVAEAAVDEAERIKGEV